MKNKFLIPVLMFFIGVLVGITSSKYLDKEIAPPSAFSPAPVNETQKVCQKIKDGIEVSLKEQKTRICQDGKALEEFPVSTGNQDNPTPSGEFSVIYKTPMLYSKIAQSWLPFWVGFHEDHGFHELPIDKDGKRVGEDKIGMTDSLGCVRLKVGDAQKIYQWAKSGTKIVIY